jgi:hypothetical protein
MVILVVQQLPVVHGWLAAASGVGAACWRVLPTSTQQHPLHCMYCARVTGFPRSASPYRAVAARAAHSSRTRLQLYAGQPTSSWSPGSHTLSSAFSFPVATYLPFFCFTLPALSAHSSHESMQESRTCTINGCSTSPARRSCSVAASQMICALTFEYRIRVWCTWCYIRHSAATFDKARLDCQNLRLPAALPQIKWQQLIQRYVAVASFKPSA